MLELCDGYVDQTSTNSETVDRCGAIMVVKMWHKCSVDIFRDNDQLVIITLINGRAWSMLTTVIKLNNMQMFTVSLISEVSACQ